jgi:cob(I)alamin adenosyltransferase
MKIYTRTGDHGTTGLFGGGRVTKTHGRIAAYGTVDEVNSFVGLALAHLPEGERAAPLRRILVDIQADLFVLGADLATPFDSKVEVPRVTREHVARLEREIDQLEEDLETLKRFILPGGSRAGATLHVARTVCRRAERLVLKAAADDEVNADSAVYLNRLSDLLFVAARWTNKLEGTEESPWVPEK